MAHHSWPRLELEPAAVENPATQEELEELEAEAANLGRLANTASKCEKAADGTTALQPMANAAFQTARPALSPVTNSGEMQVWWQHLQRKSWGLYQTSAPQGPFALVNALKAEASAAGASQISITGNALTPLSTLRGLSPGMAGRLGLQFQQISPTTILLQGGVH